MNNPPLTFIINLMTCATFIAGGSLEMMTPVNVAAVIPGTLIAHMYPKKIAEKYTGGNETILRIGDVLVHWLPAAILFNGYKRKIKNRHVLMTMLLPGLYFSLKQTKEGFNITDPIKHLKETYPGVPLWVFSIYAASALSMVR